MVDLTFYGTVVTGIGKFKTLYVPGRLEILGAPCDWPPRLEPGSLNVRVDQYPSGLADHNLSNNVSQLDLGHFVPEFVIPANQLGNNQLTPTDIMPRRGDAQVWRAELVTERDSTSIPCWVIRRLGSAVGEQLEFVAGRPLRELGLKDSARVRAVLFGEWREV